MKLNVDKLGKVAITVDENPWVITKSYDKLVVVYDEYNTGISYISRIPVPRSKQIDITNKHYWIPLGRANALISIGTFTILGSVDDLPELQANYRGPYLIDGVAYFWVGTGGDIKSGKYQSVTIKGEDGEQGPAGGQGPEGQQGPKGDDGYSAYEVAMRNKYGTDESEWESIPSWLASLKGEKGEKGEKLKFSDLTERDKAELKGAKGDTGDAGMSAYEIAMREEYEDESSWISVEDWLASLVGPVGMPGRPGSNGINGDRIMSISYDQDDNAFIFTVRKGMDLTTRTYAVPMPDDFGQGGSGETIVVREEVLQLGAGTLAQAKAYANQEENKNTYYQWVLIDTATIQENGQTVTVPVRKILWHIPHQTYYEYIDAIGGIMVSETYNANQGGDLTPA